MKYREVFRDFYRDEIRDKEIQKEYSIFIFDTNALLNVFRFTPDVANLFLNTLESVKEQIYTPYLIALEFHFNKKRVIYEYEKNVEKLEKSFKKKFDEIPKEFSNLINQSFQFRGDDNQIQTLEKKTSNEIREIFESQQDLVINVFKGLKDRSVNRYVIYEKIIQCIEPNTSDTYTQKFIDDVQQEGIKRYLENIPPGFSDKQKTGVRKYNDISYELKYGDLIIWKDILNKSKEENIKNVYFITSDGSANNKDDLLFKIGDNIIGPRIELIEEMRIRADANFYCINEAKFVDLFGRTVDDFSERTFVQLKNEIKKRNIMEFMNFNNKTAISEKELINRFTNSIEVNDGLENYLDDYLRENEFEVDDMALTGYGELNVFYIENVIINEIDFESNIIKLSVLVCINVCFDVIAHFDNEDIPFSTENQFNLNIDCIYDSNENAFEIEYISI